MKVLWFAPTPSLYESKIWGHNGGGWISSLENLFRKETTLQLGIAFEHRDDIFKVEREGVTYYPINPWKNKIAAIKRRCIYETEEQEIIPWCLKIVEDFKPDVIQVFGSEWCFGLIAQKISIPVIIHMQGCIPASGNARFPDGYSKADYILYNNFNIRKTIRDLMNDDRFLLRIKREERILRICRYYMGRTEWDRNITSLYNPESVYFHCNEVLRDAFSNVETSWQAHDRNHTVLMTIISGPLYKGANLILKTAKLLKETVSIDFEWRVFGINEMRLHEKKLKLKAKELGVQIMGIVSAERLREELLNADIFIHPSYIDNSPNSVCEAQIVGLPVISTNVGGISSLIEHKKNGLLIPANDPFTLCSYIKLLQDKSFAYSLGKNARECALVRHNGETILKRILAIYTEIIHDNSR